MDPIVTLEDPLILPIRSLNASEPGCIKTPLRRLEDLSPGTGAPVISKSLKLCAILSLIWFKKYMNNFSVKNKSGIDN